MRKNGFTAVELVLVIIVLAIVVMVVLRLVDERRQEQLRAESAATVEEIVSAMYIYATSSSTFGSRWPSLSSTPGQLAAEQARLAVPLDLSEELSLHELPPDFFTSAEVEELKAFDPTDLYPQTDVRYWYLGYEMKSEEEGLAFVRAYRESIETTGKPPTADRLQLQAPKTSSESIPQELPRLGNSHSGMPHEGFGIEELMMQGRIPVLIERPGNLKGGSNVGYMDGYVEFIPYPGPWPMTEKFIKALESLDELKGPKN